MNRPERYSGNFKKKLQQRKESTMKKTALLVIVMALIFSVAMIGPAMAETQKSEKQSATTGEMMGEKHMMGKEMKEREGCRMGDMPMHCMMSKQMIATSDGGIVVTIGNKLYKYDSSLNLQKEVEIPVDMEGMKKMMMNMKDMGMMEEKMGKDEKAVPKGATESKTKE
jgi:hypothetical protein